MRKLSELSKTYFICDGNENTVYEILSVEKENVSFKAVLNDVLGYVDDAHNIGIEIFNTLEIKKLSCKTINKIKRKEIKINDLFKKYFVN